MAALIHDANDKVDDMEKVLLILGYVTSNFTAKNNEDFKALKDHNPYKVVQKTVHFHFTFSQQFVKAKVVAICDFVDQR